MKLIAALDRNGVIGVNGKIPWRASEDMKNFQQLTWGCNVIMGRTTWESLNGPLKERLNIILSRSMTPSLDTWVAVYNKVEDVPVPRRNWVIGGRQIYIAFADVCTDLYLTIINSKENYEGDITYFPLEAFSNATWQLLEDKKLGQHNFYHFRRVRSFGENSKEGETCHESKDLAAILNPQQLFDQFNQKTTNKD